jgi:hypothetical protein
MIKIYKTLMVVLFGMLSIPAFSQLGDFDVVKEPKSNVELPNFKLLVSSGTLTTQEKDTINSTWKNESRITGTIDAKGTQRLVRIEAVDTVTGQFITQIEFSMDVNYDPSDRITSYSKTTSGTDFKLVETGNLTYGTADRYNPIKGKDSIFQSGTFFMALNTTDSIVYDGSGKMIERIKLQEVMGMSAPESRKTFVYAGSNLFQTISYIDDGGTWLEDERVTLSYDGSGNISARVFETYDETNSNWVKEELDSFTYVSGVVSAHVKYDYVGTSWVGEDKELYTYVGNKLSEMIEKEWNGTSFIDNSKLVFYYTGNKLDSALVFASNMSGGWSSTHTERVIASSGPLAGISKLNQSVMSISVFPNPANNMISFGQDLSGAEINIYSMQGQLMLSEVLDNNSVDISTLNTGVYFILIHQDGVTYRSKVSVK